MGRKFGVFCPSPLAVPEFEDHLTHYGLKDRCAGVAPSHLPAVGQEGAIIDARAAIDDFMTVARTLVARGAEVIIPGCGLIAPALRFAPGCGTAHPGGITDVDGVPIMDIYAAAMLMVETLITLKRIGSCWISRSGVFARPSAATIEGGCSAIEYTGPGFWDCK